MTNPNQADAQLTNLSDDYIRDLEPENQRYDITLAQDFVISVLPNGIKTWAFIYDFQGRHRRKTLGVFPEMNFEDAKVSLEKARASMLRMDEPTVAPNEFGQLPAVLGGSHYVAKHKKKEINISFWLKLFAALLALIAIAFLVMNRPDWLSLPSGNSEAESEPETSSLPFAVNRSESTTAPDTAQPTNSQNIAATNQDSTKDTTPAPQGNTLSQANKPTQTSESVNNASATSTGKTVESPAAKPPAPQAVVRESASAAATSQPANLPSSSQAAPKPVTTITTVTGATAFGGSVARSRLTSQVQDLEPVDTLGPEISYKNSGFTRVFYFTELREFGDGKVIHRWSLDDVVQEEVALTVKKSWRWRTYSNKDLTPGLNGQWKVETIDATGKILDTETFTYDYQ